MSVASKSRITSCDTKKAKSLAGAMAQGDQPKHAMAHMHLGGALHQDGKYPGSKGSEWKSLGNRLGQSSK